MNDERRTKEEQQPDARAPLRSSLIAHRSALIPLTPLRSSFIVHRSAFILIAAITLAMLGFSWQTWTDPLVDFGTQLYVPWQMTAGKVLYRDLAYYNGPLSQYLDAGLFELFGVSLRTLVITNLIVLAAMIVMIHRLALRASGPIAAVGCSVTFVLLFAFGQGVGVANFNWVTPYTNEITHGIALGLLAIILLDWYQRTRRRAWLATSAVVLGMVFLTKAEPFIATLAAVIAMLLSDAWIGRRPARDILFDAGIVVVVSFAVPLIALGLMALQMPIGIAARGVAGSWPWVFDARVTRLVFYRKISGTDNLPGNLLSLLRWSLVYIAALGPAVWIGLRMRRRSTAAAIFLFTFAMLAMAVEFHSIDWGSIIRPLPICLLAMLVILLRAVVRRVMPGKIAVVRLGLVVFASVLLSKVSLNPGIPHYGFALAMPGVLLFTAVLFEMLPRWIHLRGGDGNLARAIGIAGWLAAVFVTLYMTSVFVSSKRWTIGSGGDTFRVDWRGVEIGRLVEQIRSLSSDHATLVVLPQGLMVNYLSRRADPIPYLNFMPPEVLAAGEARIIATLTAHPPDIIVIDTASVDAGDFTMDRSYRYGRRTLAWVMRNYQPDPRQSNPGRFRMMRRIKSNSNPI